MHPINAVETGARLDEAFFQLHGPVSLAPVEIVPEILVLLQGLVKVGPKLAIFRR